MTAWDDQGRPTRSITRQIEPEWDDEQQDIVLGLAYYRAQVCSGCGGWLPETTNTPHTHYEVDPPSRCGACTALDIRQENDLKDQSQVRALRWPWRRTEQP